MGQYNTPGFTAAQDSVETQLFYIGRDNNHRLIEQKVGPIDDSTVDAGNSGSTYVLRPGFVFGLKDSDQKLYPLDPDANDGTQNAVGIWGGTSGLSMYESLQNPTAVDKHARVTTGGILKAATDITGINGDLEALSVLLHSGFTTLTPHGSAFGLRFKARYFKDGTALAGAYTVVAADHGCMLTAVTAAMNFTLPDLATVGRGFQVFIYNAVDANLVVTGAANTIVSGDAGGAKSTTLTFSTANAKMGAHALMYADYDGPAGALSWYALMVNRTVTTA
mgnify:FL=1